MSGTLWSQTLTTGQEIYSGSASSPALLQVQSDDDGCNTPLAASQLWRAVEAGVTSKWFVTLFNARHLPPYTGTRPWASVVESVTTRFFELELSWRPSSVSPASIAQAGTQAGVAATSEKRAVDMPTVAPLDDSCGIPA
jgi:hypothetical protein